MGNNSAGRVSGGNEGKTDMDRGSVDIGTYSKTKRQTGTVPGGMGKKPNSNKPDDNKGTVNDPRLT